MRRPEYHESWHDSWKRSYTYDSVEMWGNRSNLGYTYAYQRRFYATINTIQTIVPSGSTILDVAAAQGNFSLALAELGYNVVWNDLRHELVDYVKLKYTHGQIEYSPGNILSAEYGAEFDLVLLAEVIEHVAHPDQLLDKVARLVKPGGYILVTTPNGEYMRNTLPKFTDCPDPSIFEAVQFKPNSDGHIFLLYGDEIESFSNRLGLRLVKLSYQINPLTNGHLQLWRVLKYLPQGVVTALEAATKSMPSKIQRRIHTNMIAVLRVP